MASCRPSFFGTLPVFVPEHILKISKSGCLTTNVNAKCLYTTPNVESYNDPRQPSPSSTLATPAVNPPAAPPRSHRPPGPLPLRPPSFHYRRDGSGARWWCFPPLPSPSLSVVNFASSRVFTIPCLFIYFITHNKTSKKQHLFSTDVFFCNSMPWDGLDSQPNNLL